MEAMRSVPADMLQHAPDMVLCTTLEPCLMCMGAILLHGIGRILYGSADPYGGACTVVNSLPQFFREQLSHSEWLGPAYPETCDPLYEVIKSLEKIE
jgi:tRNA(adenine34) deaminase